MQLFGHRDESPQLSERGTGAVAARISHKTILLEIAQGGGRRCQ
jgi:hypothetical protein